MMDEHEHDATHEEWEVVSGDEASLEDYPVAFERAYERQETETHWADGTQKFDEFGAPIKAVVKVREGGQDAKARPPR